MGPTCCWWRFPIATKHSHFSGLAVGRPHSIWIAQSSPSPRRISRGSWRTWRQWASPCYQSKHGISVILSQLLIRWIRFRPIYVTLLQLHWLNIDYHCFWNWDMVLSTYHIPQCMWSQLAPRMLRASLAQRCQISGLIRWCFYPEVWWCSKLRMSWFQMFWSGFIFRFFWFHAKKRGFIYTYIYNMVSARDVRILNPVDQNKPKVDAMGSQHVWSTIQKASKWREYKKWEKTYLRQTWFWQGWNNIYSLQY